MNIFKALLAIELLLAGGAKAEDHIEEYCASTNITCIESFKADHGGRRVAEDQVFDHACMHPWQSSK